MSRIAKMMVSSQEETGRATEIEAAVNIGTPGGNGQVYPMDLAEGTEKVLWTAEERAVRTAAPVAGTEGEREKQGWWGRHSNQKKAKKAKKGQEIPVMLSDAPARARNGDMGLTGIAMRLTTVTGVGELSAGRDIPTQTQADTRGLKSALHQKVLDDMAARPNWTRQEAKARVLAIVDTALSLQQTQLRRAGERAELIDSLLNDVFGLGPIQKLVDDPSVDEIMVNGPYEVFVEKKGRVYVTDVKFDSVEHEMGIIERIVGSVGRRVDESFPMADARLADGSRVNVVLPPLALKGPCLTIRKFRAEHYTGAQLIEMGASSPYIMDFLKEAVESKENILITGGTSSGKTTLLNIMSGFISDSERIVTIEDAAELRLNQRHVVPLETRPPNSEGKGTIVIRDLVKNALRMRPDRIVVGEVRGPEALDMIQAMNTGHDGSMSTLHANSSADALQRLEAMAMMAGVELPSESIRFQISSAISLVVHTERVSGGSRKIVDVSEVVRKRGELQTRTIFHYQQAGVDTSGNATGEFSATGVVPSCLARIRGRGGVVDDAIFAAVGPERRSHRHTTETQA